MSRFIAEISQGGGCDYTIECGTAVLELKAKTMEEAHQELYRLCDRDYYGERQLSSITIYEISKSESIDVGKIYQLIQAEDKARKAAEAEKKERAELERLKSKYGK